MAPPHNQFHPNQTGLCPALRRSSTKNPLLKFPAKAPGADGWTAQLLNNLSETAVRFILEFMHACEAAAEWPAQFAISLIACLPKNTLRERPIALLHVRSCLRRCTRASGKGSMHPALQAAYGYIVP